MKLQKHFYLKELAYKGNIGFEEMVRFMDVADQSQIVKMELFIKNNDWQGFKKLIEKILGIKIK